MVVVTNLAIVLVSFSDFFDLSQSDSAADLSVLWRTIISEFHNVGIKIKPPFLPIFHPGTN